jgi:phage terminase large subunit GpA-like protein
MNAITGAPTPGEGAPPPPHATAAAALRRALPTLAPPVRMAPSAAAVKWRRLGPFGARLSWSNATAPYMVEPMDVSISRRFGAAVFAGPARSGKTDGLVLNPLLHRTMCEPTTALVVHMSQHSARDFSIEKLDPMIRATPEMAARQLVDNVYEKTFLGGMRMTIGWPVIGHLSGRDIPLVIFTDYDRLPANIDGEGDPFALGRKRTQTFGSLGMTIAESSPGRPIEDEDWKPDPAEPHRAPPCGGILALFNEGTRGRWYWRCDGCREDFEPLFDRLVYDRKGTPFERGERAEMACPHCGHLHMPARKAALNEAAHWLHEGADGSLVPISGKTRATDVASWWLAGPAATFQTWAQMVARYESAMEVFRWSGNEEALKTTVNVDQGWPYRPSALGAGAGLTPGGLRAAAVRLPVRTVPAAARFLTAAVDTQTSRWVVQVDAWGPGMERWTIDRFEVVAPPPGAPGGERAVAPARYAEDWAALDAIFDRFYPVEGGGYRLGVAAQIVDAFGEAGVTPNAYAFYRRHRRQNPRRVFLARGMPGFNRPRAVEVEPEKVLQKKGARAKGLKIVQVGTDRLKDEVTASLARTEPGPGAHHLADGLPDEVFAELCAERREMSGWKAKEGIRRNEALDCSVYGKALAIVLRAEQVDWANPPAWCAAPGENAFARIVEARAVLPLGPADLVTGLAAVASAVAGRPVAAPAPPAELVLPVHVPPRRRRMRSAGI